MSAPFGLALAFDCEGEGAYAAPVLPCRSSVDVATLAVRAALLEAAAEPKPGLVCPHSSGAHRDMDFDTFVRSALALGPYFGRAHALGWATRGALPTGVFPRLRALGLAAERSMFRATGGINTHKGLIFSLSLFCAALGRLSGRKLRAAELCVTAGAFARGIVARDFAPLAAVRAAVSSGVLAKRLVGPPGKRRAALESTVGRRLTPGEVVFLLYGATGVRGQAERGFPQVLQAWEVLQALEGGNGQISNLGMVHCLLELILEMGDTTLLWRGGARGLRLARGHAGAVLAHGGLALEEGRRALRRMCATFNRRRLSPGGCADILAIAVFLHSLGGHIDPSVPAEAATS